MMTRLTWPADGPRLQQLLERCSDYYELHEGWPTQPDTAEYEMTFIPSGYQKDDLVLFAIEDGGGTLQAMIQILRNTRGGWWIALLVVAPEQRGRGHGSELVRHAAAEAAADGATVMRLSVSVNNPRGERFWKAAGFRPEGEPIAFKARNGHTDTGQIMSRAI